MVDGGEAEAAALASLIRPAPCPRPPPPSGMVYADAQRTLPPLAGRDVQRPPVEPTTNLTALAAATAATEPILFIGSITPARKETLQAAQDQLKGRVVVAPPTWSVQALDAVLSNYTFVLNLHKRGEGSANDPLEVRPAGQERGWGGVTPGQAGSSLSSPPSSASTPPAFRSRFPTLPPQSSHECLPPSLHPLVVQAK